MQAPLSELVEPQGQERGRLGFLGELQRPDTLLVLFHLEALLDVAVAHLDRRRPVLIRVHLLAADGPAARPPAPLATRNCRFGQRTEGHGLSNDLRKNSG